MENRRRISRGLGKMKLFIDDNKRGGTPVRPNSKNLTF